MSMEEFFNKKESAESLLWQAPEYEHSEQTPDWFWAVGIITICLAIGSAIYGNFLFSIFILLAIGILLAYKLRQPNIITFEINDKGIQIKDALFHYKDMRNFCIDRRHEVKKILVNMNTVLTPLLDIPLPDEIDENILIEIISKKVPEEEIKEPLSHRIMKYLGF